MSPSRLLTLLCALAALAFAVGAVIALGDRLGLLGGAHARAAGEVVGAESETDSDGDTRYRAVVQFEVDGETHLLTASKTSPWHPNTGDDRTVLYAVDDPDDASLLGVREVATVPGLLLLGALASAFVLRLRVQTHGFLRPRAENG